MSQEHGVMKGVPSEGFDRPSLRPADKDVGAYSRFTIRLLIEEPFHHAETFRMLSCELNV
jgi:hypothetical protein